MIREATLIYTRRFGACSLGPDPAKQRGTDFHRDARLELRGWTDHLDVLSCYGLHELPAIESHYLEGNRSQLMMAGEGEGKTGTRSAVGKLAHVAARLVLHSVQDTATLRRLLSSKSRVYREPHGDSFRITEQLLCRLS